jgi:hypothetical protein
MIPNYTLETKVINSKEYLFDELRKKWVLMTPEEVVRQNCWKYLHLQKNYPKSLFVIEKQISVNGLAKRFDLLIYNNDGKPEMIIECKKPSLKIDDNVLNQILSYQSKLNARYLLISNGLESYCLHVNLRTNKVDYLKEIPACDFF